MTAVEDFSQSDNSLTVPRYGDDYDVSSSDFSFTFPSDNPLLDQDNHLACDIYDAPSSDFTFAPSQSSTSQISPASLQVLGVAKRRVTKRIEPVPHRVVATPLTEDEKFFVRWRTELCKLGYASDAIIDGKHIVFYVGHNPATVSMLQDFFKNHDNHTVFEYAHVELL